MLYTGFSMSVTLTAAVDDDGRRLDRVLRKALPELPLSALHRLFRQGKIKVNGIPASAAFRVRAGETMEVPGEIRAGSSRKQIPSPPARFSLDILREGDGLLILNKPAGMAVHGPGSLDEQVQTYLAPKLPFSLSFRPGPLHRLDKPTSGVIVFSTNLEGARRFSTFLGSGDPGQPKVRKIYLAITDGTLERDEIWEDDLIRDHDLKKTRTASPAETCASRGQSKPALTRITSLALAGGRSLIRAEIGTGRTHQIRAQAAARGHPLSGDRKYGGKPLPGTSSRGGDFFLHAWVLEFPTGDTDAPLRIEAPLPAKFIRAMQELFGCPPMKLKTLLSRAAWANSLE
jgi:23S rRNA pseudouridine955/2504/2580 synthase